MGRRLRRSQGWPASRKGYGWEPGSGLESTRVLWVPTVDGQQIEPETWAHAWRAITEISSNQPGVPSPSPIQVPLRFWAAKESMASRDSSDFRKHVPPAYMPSAEAQFSQSLAIGWLRAEYHPGTSLGSKRSLSNNSNSHRRPVSKEPSES
jgi:hypothetical protein